MKCPICRKELDPAIRVIGPDGYLFHMSAHVKSVVHMGFDLLEEIARNGKVNMHTIPRARRILKERQAIRNAIKEHNNGH